MGKYFKKSKLTPAIALMEVSPHSSPGFRTRAAKTLALQRLNKSALTSTSLPLSSSSSSSSYLQLRSRRLEKPPLLTQNQKAQQNGECCRGRLTLECSSTDSRLKRDVVNSEKRKLGGGETPSGNVWDVDDCFAENCLEFGGENWGTGKTHTNVARDSCTEIFHSTRMETISSSTKSRPTANDIEEFFAHEELWHQRTFIQKYNFDFTSEMPLQGRYEWVQVAP